MGIKKTFDCTLHKNVWRKFCYGTKLEDVLKLLIQCTKYTTAYTALSPTTNLG